MDMDCRTWIQTWIAGHGLHDMDRRTGIAGHGHGHELQDMYTDMDCRTWTRTWVRTWIWTRRHWIQYKYDILRQESVQLNEVGTQEQYRNLTWSYEHAWCLQQKEFKSVHSLSCVIN